MMPACLLMERDNHDFCCNILWIFMETLDLGIESGSVGWLNGHVYVSYRFPNHLLLDQRGSIWGIFKCCLISLHFSKFSFSFFKSLLNLLQYCFCFMFWVFGHKACGILAFQPGVVPTSTALECEVLTTELSGKCLVCLLKCVAAKR